MKKFLIKSFAFLTIITVLISLLCMRNKPPSENDYLYGMKSKHQRLDAIQSPKIILAGGSNLAFGINSEKIEEAFSIPVVNLSLIASLGTDFILEELKNSIKPGDIVLLSFEYPLDKDGSNRVKTRASDQFPEAKKYYNLNAYSSFLLALEDASAMLKNGTRNFINPGLKNPKKPIYNKNAFNKYGDVISHYGEKRKKQLAGRKLKYKYPKTIDEINQFHDFAEKMNVHLFYLFPTYTASQYKLNEDEIKLLHKYFKTDLNTKIINEPKSFVYPDSLFFDTVYHLTEEGIEKRTSKFIKLLKENKKATQVLLKTKPLAESYFK